MSVPYRCPICLGVGKVQWNPDNPYLAVQGIQGSANTPPVWDCRSCAGRGIVWAPSDVIPAPGACQHAIVYETAGGERYCMGCGTWVFPLMTGTRQ